MKTFLEHLELVTKERIEELTQNTIDFKTSQTGKIQVTVVDSKTGAKLYDMLFAGNLLVKQVINKAVEQAKIKDIKVDASINSVKEKTIESITDNNIIEFQVNQNGVLVLNADLLNKTKTAGAAPVAPLIK